MVRKPTRPSAAARMAELRKEIETIEKQAVEEGQQFLAKVKEAVSEIEPPGECSVTLSYDAEGTLSIAFRGPGAGRTPPRRTGGDRDNRLPAAGETIRKVHRGKEHEITFTETNAVLLDGTEFGSVSAAAKHLSGSATNGFQFFGLK